MEPVDTMNTMKYQFRHGFFPLLLAALLLLYCILPTPARAMEQPYLNAKAAVLMDASSGEMLFSQNADTPLYVAGLTSMMTCLLAAEAEARGEIAYTDMVTASNTSHNDITADASIQNIVPGETLRLDNLLYCALVGSASEACNIIGEYVAGGSASDFVALMNRRAQELGCTNTRFVNMHGLPVENHYSTAHDMALIASEFVKHDKLMDISNTVSKEIPATDYSAPRYLSSGNYILRTDYTRYYYSYASGIKSSFTEEAGYCLASSVKTEDTYVVSVVLGCDMVEADDGYFDIQSFVQTKKLFRWFFDNYSLRYVVNPIEPVAEVPVSMGEGTDSVVVCAGEGLALFLPNEMDIAGSFRRDIRIYSQEEGAEPLVAPVHRGQVLGEVTVTAMDGTVYGPYSLSANTDVEVSRYAMMQARVKETLSSRWLKLTLLGVVLILALYIAFVIRYNVIRAKRRKALQEGRSIPGGKRK